MNAIEDRVAVAVEHVAKSGVVLPMAPAVLDAVSLARLIDHTLLKADATSEQIRVLCDEARRTGFASVCVNASWVPLCVDELAGSGVRVCAVAGFPLGATLPSVKAYEAQQIVALGGTEVDMVINVGRLKDGDYRMVLEDVAAVADECHAGRALLKVIFETGLLTFEEKIAACVICLEAGADFVKTSTGFGSGGATVEDVALMRMVIGPQMGIKAAGGVRTAQDAMFMVAAGATRIGTSSGVRLVAELAGVGAVASAPGDTY